MAISLRNRKQTLSYEGGLMDSFMHYHQSALDSQREEAEINWLFPQDDEEEEIEDKDFPYEEE